MKTSRLPLTASTAIGSAVTGYLLASTQLPETLFPLWATVPVSLGALALGKFLYRQGATGEDRSSFLIGTALAAALVGCSFGLG